MGTVEILLENERRRARILGVAYNPFTGEGCCGERVCVEVGDLPVGWGDKDSRDSLDGGTVGALLLYLPVEMAREPFVVALREAGSILALAGGDAGRARLLWVMFCETRARYDFEFFAATYETIFDKNTADIRAFILRRPQRRVLARLEMMRKADRPVRLILLKARQWGGSTLIQMYMLWIQVALRRRWSSSVCSLDLTSAYNVRMMYEKSIEMMPPLRGVSYELKNLGNTGIRVLSESGSRIMIGTAERPNSLRSHDLKMAHLSEVGLYENTAKRQTADLVTSITGSVPLVPLSLIALESTARGVGNYFHSEWLRAKAGETNFDPVFVAWFEIEIYSREFLSLDSGQWTVNSGQLGDGKDSIGSRDSRTVGDGRGLCRFTAHGGREVVGRMDEFVDSMTDYERMLFDTYEDCTLENLNWYRGKRAEFASDALMQQEYPSNDIEAFQNSGSPAFRAEDVERLRGGCRLPLDVGELRSEVDPYNGVIDKRQRRGILKDVRFVRDAEALGALASGDARMIASKCRNRLYIWKHPPLSNDIKNRYVVVYDPSRGVSEGADFGDIVVFDRCWMMDGGVPEVVAELHFKEDRDVAIWRAAMIARYYHNALLVIESNTPDSTTGRYEAEGEFIFDVIADHYNNMYTRTPAEKIREGAPVKWGFFTGRAEKNMLVAEHNAVLREGGYVERNVDAVDEQRVYEQKHNGSYGAVVGRKDDMTMTRMLGTYVCYSLPVPRAASEVAGIRRQRGGGVVSEMTMV